MPERKYHEQVWEEFWSELCTNPDGSLNLDAIQRELADYHTALREVSKVYDYITGGRITKLNTDSLVVIAEADEYMGNNEAIP